MAIGRILMLGALLMSVAVSGGEVKKNSAVIPVSRTGEFMVERNDLFNARIKEADPELIFIGDSITQAWEDNGKETWSKYYAKRKAFNLGISGDRTEHVLYRLAHGNLEGIDPKLAVVMIGTNNSKANSSEEIAEGITAIVKMLGEKLPRTKVLLLGVFPRSEHPDALRDKLARVNRIIARLADDKEVYFLDVGIHFLEADKTISKEIMPDFLHLTPRGYDLWAAAMEGTIRRLLGENPCSW